MVQDKTTVLRCVPISVRNNGRSTATRPAAPWQDRQVFASVGPLDRELIHRGCIANSPGQSRTTQPRWPALLLSPPCNSQTAINLVLFSPQIVVMIYFNIHL